MVQTATVQRNSTMMNRMENVLLVLKIANPVPAAAVILASRAIMKDKQAVKFVLIIVSNVQLLTNVIPANQAIDSTKRVELVKD